MRWQRMRRRLDRMSYLHLAVRLGVLLTIVAPILVATRGFWRSPQTYGFHDWDVMAAHRLLSREALLEHAEFPGWNPYLCGGFPAWGYIEGGTTVVSPLLPVYLLCDLPTALRVEVIVMGLVGAAGTYFAAGFVSRRIGPRAFAIGLFAVNGRFGLQVASGHLWHLAYALLPWCVGFYLAALEAESARRTRYVVLLGVCLAWMVYAGGIYPLPHTVLSLVVLSLTNALLCRTLAAPRIVLAGGAIGIGLSAPKLLPMLSTFSAVPRRITSTEVFSLPDLYIAMTSRVQGFYDRPAPVRPYGWHEWGTYVGPVGVALLVGAFAFAWRRDLLPIKLIGLLLFGLGLGAFHPASPWAVLHAHAPFFGSLHVPSRFLYPAAFFGGLLVAGVVSALIRRLRRRAPRLVAWTDAACALSGFALAIDIASVAKQPLDQTMWMTPPAVVREREFTTAERSPIAYVKRDWADSMLLPMMANTGVRRCYGLPIVPAEGTSGRAADDYKGEAYIETAGARRDRSAWASVDERTHNRIAVDIEGAEVGDRLMINSNFFDGWRASTTFGDGSTSDTDLVAGDQLGALLGAGATRVTFTYRPPYLVVGVCCAIVTLLACAAAMLRSRLFGTRRRRG